MALRDEPHRIEPHGREIVRGITLEVLTTISDATAPVLVLPGRQVYRRKES